jgi:tetratricopeptide (TPR) repeat protein
MLFLSRILSVLFFLVFLPTSTRAEFLSPKLFDKVMKATELAYADNILESLDAFKNIQKEFPDHPVGYFYEIAVLEKMQSDYMNNYRENDFREIFKKAIQVAEQFTKDHPKDPQGYFFLGGIEGFYGIHYYRVGGLLSVFSYALSAVNNLYKAKDIDPLLYDVYYGLGSYTYWKADKAPFLYFFGRKRQADKERGISNIMTAARKGVYSLHEARGALVKMLMNENRHREAAHWLEETLEKYPTSLYAHRFRAEIYLKEENWQGVFENACAMEKLIFQKKYAGPEAFVNALYLKGLSAMKLYKKTEAVEAFRKCVEIGEPVKKQMLEYGPWVSKSKKFLKKLER